MVQSFDIGSFPFPGDMDKFVKGARNFEKGVVNESANYFEQTIVNVFLDKLAAGIDIPNFPQFRDMNEMFLSVLKGVESLKEGYVETAPLTLKHGGGCLPEVLAIKKNARVICEKHGQPFTVKVCVTGPYTLASFFPHHNNETFSRLGETLSQVIEGNVFSEKTGGVEVVSVDEPLFGLVDDPLIDHGSEGREDLFKAWSAVFHSAKAKKVRTCLHLHNTSDGLFWGVRALEIVESHVDDSLYRLNETKERLEREDKVLKGSACVVDFDRLIREGIKKASRQKLNNLTLDEAVAETWKKIQKGLVAPEGFLEVTGVMHRRINKIIERFGVERVPFVGPECGLRGFPTYECAVECLRRVAEVGRSLVV